jgi:hypothetical protein
LCSGLFLLSDAIALLGLAETGPERMNPVQINNIDHAYLRVSPRAGAEFGDAANQAPVFPAEFEELQREFAIIFRRRETGLQAYALLGLDRDENL